MNSKKQGQPNPGPKVVASPCTLLVAICHNSDNQFVHLKEQYERLQECLKVVDVVESRLDANLLEHGHPEDGEDEHDELGNNSMGQKIWKLPKNWAESYKKHNKIILIFPSLRDPVAAVHAT